MDRMGQMGMVYFFYSLVRVWLDVLALLQNRDGYLTWDWAGLSEHWLHFYLLVVLSFVVFSLV